MYNSAPINNWYKPKLLIETAGHATVTLQVDKKFFHAAQSIHGSVYFKLLDDAAFFAANSLDDKFFVVTASFTTHLLRPVNEGLLTAIGNIQHESSRLIIAESKIIDAKNRLIAVGNGSFMTSKVPLSEKIGYA